MMLSTLAFATAPVFLAGEFLPPTCIDVDKPLGICAPHRNESGITLGVDGKNCGWWQGLIGIEVECASTGGRPNRSAKGRPDRLGRSYPVRSPRGTAIPIIRALPISRSGTRSLVSPTHVEATRRLNVSSAEQRSKQALRGRPALGSTTPIAALHLRRSSVGRIFGNSRLLLSFTNLVREANTLADCPIHGLARYLLICRSSRFTPIGLGYEPPDD